MYPVSILAALLGVEILCLKDLVHSLVMGLFWRFPLPTW